MEILHFVRNEESEFHIHAYSSASCFYIPSKNVILFAEERGAFGDATFSISTNQPLINEAKALWENQKHNSSAASFSNVKKIEYDDKKLLNLIKNAKEHTSLETKVKKSIQELLNLANPKPEPIKSIDPATIDESAKQHLERILQSVVNEDRTRYIASILRPEKREETHQQQYREKIRTDFEEFTRGRLNSNDLISYMNSAHEQGVVDIAQQYAKIILQEQKIVGDRKRIFGITYTPKEYYGQASLIDKLDAAIYLDKPEPYLKKIHAQLFYANLIEKRHSSSGEQFLADIEKYSPLLSQKEKNKAAEKAYDNLMWPSRRYDYPDYVQAARIAKIYLSEEEFITAAKKVVENYQVVIGHTDSIIGQEIFDLSLPDDLSRPLMAKIFGSLLKYNKEYAEKNRMYCHLTDEEIKPQVNEVHNKFLKNGNFTKVLELRANYASLIETQTPSNDDLKTLIGIETYQSQQRRQPQHHLPEYVA